MSVEDFPPRPQAPADSEPYQRWIDALRNRQNIDALQSLASVASGDEFYVFDVSETGQNKTKKATVAVLTANLNTFHSIAWDCKNNSASASTSYDLEADHLVLINGAGGAVYDPSPGSVTVSISTAGPAANGRDQSGAFSNSSWVHFYRIWGDGQSDAGIASTSATAPTLPTGYTHYAYAGAVRLNGSGALLSTYIKGDTVYYKEHQNVVNGAGTAKNTETSVDVSSVVPPNAHAYAINVRMTFANDVVGADIILNERVISTFNVLQQEAFEQTVNGPVAFTGHGLLFNVSQQFYYIWTDNAGTTGGQSISFWVHSYKVPNGE